MRAVRLAAILLGLTLASSAAGQAWPAKPIRLVNPLGTGGTAEVLARAIAQQLSAGLGQPVVVETKTGATGTIGADFVAKSPPDGYTLLYGVTGTNAIAPSLYPKLPYDPDRDLEPISLLFSGPNVLIVHQSLNAGSVQDLVALAKQKPGTISFASAGPGSMSHLNAELFRSQMAVDLLHVPYKGGGAAVPDLLAGRVQMMIETNAGVLPLVRAGKMKPLAVTTPQRTPSLPDVPTFTELGYPELTTVVWGGLFAPGGTPRAIIDRLAEECAKAARNPAYRDYIATLNNEAVASTPQEFQALVRGDMAKYSGIVRKLGLKLD